MAAQSEAILENNLIKQLIGLGYVSAKVMDGDALVDNLKAQLEAFNKATYSDKEFDGILNHLAKGNVFQKAKTLRDRFSFTQENGEIAYVRFFNSENSASLASARAGNVIGGGDWSDDRLIPDILRAFEKSEPVIIRNPLSTRPWQHVLEPISGYLVLAENLYNHGDDFAEGWNFGPKDEDCKPVNWILDRMVDNWGGDASWKLDKNNNPHEAVFLKLDCSKAANRLKWHPKWELKETLKMIVNWHQNYLNEMS